MIRLVEPRYRGSHPASGPLLRPSTRYLSSLLRRVVHAREAVSSPTADYLVADDWLLSSRNDVVMAGIRAFVTVVRLTRSGNDNRFNSMNGARDNAC